MILTDGIALVFLVRTAQVHATAARPAPVAVTTRYDPPAALEAAPVSGWVLDRALDHGIPFVSGARTNQP